MKIHQKRLLITLGIGLVLILSFFLITEAITKYTGFLISPTEDDDFEICLEEQDITLYINSAEISKTLNKLKLVNYLDKVDIINCQINNLPCLDNGINLFPSWKINGEVVKRDISLDELAEYSDCEVINKV